MFKRVLSSQPSLLQQASVAYAFGSLPPAVNQAYLINLSGDALPMPGPKSRLHLVMRAVLGLVDVDGTDGGKHMLVTGISFWVLTNGTRYFPVKTRTPTQSTLTIFDGVLPGETYYDSDDDSWGVRDSGLVGGSTGGVIQTLSPTVRVAVQSQSAFNTKPTLNITLYTRYAWTNDLM